MQSFIMAFTVVCPLFLMMALGYFLRQIKVFSEDFLDKLNELCFNVFLPVILFMNIYESDFHASFKPGLVIFAMACVLASFVLLMIIVPRFEKEDARRGVIIQGIFRSNYLLFGLPVASSLFGGAGDGVTAVLIAFVVPFYNVLAVIALEKFRGKKASLGVIIKGVAKNPLIIGAVLGFALELSGFVFPDVINKTASDIAGIGTPLSLIVLGGSFVFSRLRGNVKSLIISVCGKLIVLPMIILTLAVAVGYRGVDLGAILIMVASPTAVSSFSMAQQMGGDDELAGQIIVLTSAICVLTMFLWISIISGLGLLRI